MVPARFVLPAPNRSTTTSLEDFVNPKTERKHRRQCTTRGMRKKGEESRACQDMFVTRWSLVWSIRVGVGALSFEHPSRLGKLLPIGETDWWVLCQDWSTCRPLPAQAWSGWTGGTAAELGS